MDKDRVTECLVSRGMIYVAVGIYDIFYFYTFFLYEFFYSFVKCAGVY